jgi:SEC-C motif-containing protein
MQNCPCGTSKSYMECCGLFIDGKHLPSTPEQLMRSRYTAYSKANINYIKNTMQPPASDNFDEKEAKQWAKKIKWTRLEVKSATQNDENGTVEFIAYYTVNNKNYRLHEISEFHCINEKWFYVDGQILDE